jgi:hypothetical protein
MYGCLFEGLIQARVSLRGPLLFNQCEISSRKRVMLDERLLRDVGGDIE